MELCSLCESIDFFDLPPLPSHYGGNVFPWERTQELFAFLSIRLSQARRAGEDENAGEFSLPLGTPYHQSVDELRIAAENCPICSLVERSVSRCLALLSEAEKDEEYVYQQSKIRRSAPDWRLWLTNRRDGCEGFWVISSGDKREAWLIAAVGFSVEANDPLSTFIPGRPIQVDSASDETIGRALGWVQECNTQHVGTRCIVGQPELPNRVLDVNYESASSGLRLYETNGARGEYIALSHMWGSQYHLTTTRSNLVAHMEEIIFTALPKTFQDAVTLTRKLGIQYLWIDSLCICQDDGPDWERESAKMASIYMSSYLTIAATGSTGDTEGVFLQRTPPDYSHFQYKTKDGLRGIVNAFLLPKVEAAYENRYCSLSNEPLTQRGWALQERYLASRILHFSTTQMYFECYNHFRAEDGFRSKGRFISIHPETHPYQVDSTDNSYPGSEYMQHYRVPTFSLWYYILTDYYGRSLTKSSDKLPALSGIARAFELKTKDKYVAGLWRSNMIEGMLWQTMGTARGKVSKPPQYRAPSWSWASIDGPFATPGLGKHIFDATTTFVDIGTVLDSHVELRGENPYGEVLFGSVTVNAPLELLAPSQEEEPDCETVPYKRPLRMTTKMGDKFGIQCRFDTISDDEALKSPLCALILVRTENVEDIPENRVYQGLIVTPVEGREGNFRRLGNIVTGYNSIGECDWMTDPSKLVTVTLI